MSTAIEFSEITLRLPNGRTLLDAISFSVEQGTTTALLGRSGSGKTTLLRTVNRMIEPTSGEIKIHGQDVRHPDVIALRRSMGYVIQETGLFPHLSVERNVAMVPESMGRAKAERNRQARELLSKVGLDPDSFASRYPHQLSGGQRQRVGLARALAADPQFLLMDEPFGALDPLTRAEMQDMLLDLMKQLRKTILLVTHDLDEALYLADRIVLLRDGKLVAHLAPEEFLHSAEPAVIEYVRAFHRGEKHAEAAS